jgi:hypothetical protein
MRTDTERGRSETQTKGNSFADEPTAQLPLSMASTAVHALVGSPIPLLRLCAQSLWRWCGVRWDGPDLLLLLLSGHGWRRRAETRRRAGASTEGRVEGVRRCNRHWAMVAAVGDPHTDDGCWRLLQQAEARLTGKARRQTRHTQTPHAIGCRTLQRCVLTPCVVHAKIV